MSVVIGNTYPSTKYGNFTVLDRVKNNNNETVYLIQFKYSTAIIQASGWQITHGQVRDPWYCVNPNMIHYSNNYGPFKVLSINSGTVKDHPTATIQFILSGTIKTIDVDYIKTGCVKDENVDPKTILPLDTSLLHPYIREFRINQILRVKYHKTLQKCKNKNSTTYEIYGARGVTICERWLDVNNFLNDVKYLPQYDKFYKHPTLYELDKDFKQIDKPTEQKVYSPETCMFIHYLDNENIMNYKKKLTFTSPNSSKYFGIFITPKGQYEVRIYVRGTQEHFGVYSDEIAAANAYNYYYEFVNRTLCKKYDIFPLFNNVPQMSYDEFNRYLVYYNLKYDKNFYTHKYAIFNKY